MEASLKRAVMLFLLLALLSAAALAAPAAGTARADDFALDATAKVAVWSAIPEATDYVLSVKDEDGKEVFSANTRGMTRFPLAEAFPCGGEYTLTVTAFSDLSPLSSASAVVSVFSSLSPPSFADLSEGVLTWSAVTGATSYSLVVNGIPVGEYTLPSADLSREFSAGGVFTVSVTALGDAYNTDSEAFVRTFTLPVPPLPPEDARVSVTGGLCLASWIPREDEIVDTFVYELIFEDEVPVSAQTTLNYADLSALVSKDGEYLFVLYALRDGVWSAPLAISFSTTTGGDAA